MNFIEAVKLLTEKGGKIGRGDSGVKLTPKSRRLVNTWTNGALLTLSAEAVLANDWWWDRSKLKGG